MEHGHQQLGQHNNHHDVVGAYDHGAHEGTQLLRVADARDKERNMRQGEDVPEQGVAGPHKPVRRKKLVSQEGVGAKRHDYQTETDAFMRQTRSAPA